MSTAVVQITEQETADMPAGARLELEAAERLRYEQEHRDEIAAVEAARAQRAAEVKARIELRFPTNAGTNLWELMAQADAAWNACLCVVAREFMSRERRETAQRLAVSLDNAARCRILAGYGNRWSEMAQLSIDDLALAFSSAAASPAGGIATRAADERVGTVRRSHRPRGPS